ncbi:NAD(P)/FAD-dependent oxidoreductase [Methyloversatilis thermotolerans]|uniref:NAD(P)/FAD-dependent oxidoreductase n=1 Tax=Methyloversatilis thermotolerans TaxID=1346290 RepID=UPI00037B19C8|nr:FAD-dependent oxidoreductase [Methyloversatilis thermotolerans]
MRNVAVIGAGMAGCVVARRLVDAGLSVHVFDKGRAAGGRMASRRAGLRRFDHGAQFMTVRGHAMRSWLDDWQRAGVIAPWEGACTADNARWVAVPGMNALAPRMLWGAELHAGTRVLALRRDRYGFALMTEAGPVADCFDAVVLTMPAPQATELLRSSDLEHAEAMRADLDRVRYEPCWSLMLAFDSRLPVEDVLRPAAGPLSWAARDSSKPQRDPSQECWVAHAGADWSTTHLESAPEDIATALTQSFLAQIPGSPSPVHQTAHRWRYARVSRALGRPCLWHPEIGLGYASDGCIGARIEDAFDSGFALADSLLGQDLASSGRRP